LPFLDHHPTILPCCHLTAMPCCRLATLAPSLPPWPPSVQEDALLAFFRGPGLLTPLRNSTNQLLLMGGSQDAVFPISTQVQGASSLLAAALLQVPDAGHVSACPQAGWVMTGQAGCLAGCLLAGWLAAWLAAWLPGCLAADLPAVGWLWLPSVLFCSSRAV